MTYWIAGARARIDDPEAELAQVHAWAARHNAEVAVADALAVFGPDHVQTAALHALRAQAAGTMISHSLAMETLRYLAAKRQVADAIHGAGIRRGTRAVAVVVFASEAMDDLLRSAGWTRDDTVLELDDKSLEPFGVTKEEAATIPAERRGDLVLEKVALLDALR